MYLQYLKRDGTGAERGVPSLVRMVLDEGAGTTEERQARVIERQTRLLARVIDTLAEKLMLDPHDFDDLFNFSEDYRREVHLSLEITAKPKHDRDANDHD